MKNILSIFCLAALTSGAAPTIDNVVVTQGEVTNSVNISYSLSERAIVTFEATTNGAPVAADSLWSAVGDVFRIVEAGNRRILWLPGERMPDLDLATGALKIKLRVWSTDDPPTYFTIDLRRPLDKRFYADVATLPLGISNELYKTHVLAMRRIPAKDVTWRMGGDSDTWHNVQMTNDYYIGVYEVTQQQYVDFQGSNPSRDQTNVNWRIRPVEYFARYNAIYFVRRDNSDDGCAANTPANFNAKPNEKEPAYLLNLRTVSGIAFDLPTEAQWEFAARAGSGDSWICGVNSGDLGDYGWFKDNSTNELGIRGTHPVGLKKPNRWGLYDMAGNVREACIDWNTSNYGLSQEVLADGTSVQVEPNGGAKNSVGRELRGGSFNSSANDCRLFARLSSNNGDSDTGMRLVCPVDMTGK